MKLIAVDTQEKYNALMRELEARGCKWYGKELPTKVNVWGYAKEHTVISVENNVLGKDKREFYEHVYSDVPIIDYEIKKFKIGDRVKHKEFEWEGIVKYVYDNGSFGINGAPFFYYPESCELVESLEKVRIPQYVANYIESLISRFNGDVDLMIRDAAILKLTNKRPLNNTEKEVIKNENIITLISAIRNGYEVEKEPLYYVKLPFVEKHQAYLNMSSSSGIWFSDKISYSARTKFTKSEINEIDKRFWQFAVPVEEDD
ncbi:DUF1642 domain-containing protein [Listeria sp. ILCC797]|uniref:DUF1642 domain-containing protein n=1 Tax=Listeria sp. ILCC797 TaxID=1918333 RepID=UPI000B589C60|nr:DUF1642 domain-containing protein [Listeria sp. ILCC797]